MIYRQGVRSVMVGSCWWSSRRLSKKLSRELHEGADYQQDPNNTVDSLKASMSANPATMEHSGSPKCYGGSYWGSFHSCPKNSISWGCREKRIINRIHNNTLDFLKASIMTGFADMPREENTLLLMICSSLQPPGILFIFKSLQEDHQQYPP